MKIETTPHPSLGFEASTPVGTEWVIEAFDCDASRLRDVTRMASLCDRVITDLDLRVVGEPMRHQFPMPGGVTTLYLLSESHLACHTYPEIGLATFNLYCCRDRQPWCWETGLRQDLNAREVRVRKLSRGWRRER